MTARLFSLWVSLEDPYAHKEKPLMCYLESYIYINNNKERKQKLDGKVLLL